MSTGLALSVLSISSRAPAAAASSSTLMILYPEALSSLATVDFPVPGVPVSAIRGGVLTIPPPRKERMNAPMGKRNIDHFVSLA